MDTGAGDSGQEEMCVACAEQGRGVTGHEGRQGGRDRSRGGLMPCEVTPMRAALTTKGPLDLQCLEETDGGQARDTDYLGGS